MEGCSSLETPVAATTWAPGPSCPSLEILKLLSYLGQPLAVPTLPGSAISLSSSFSEDISVKNRHRGLAAPQLAQGYK